MHVNNNDDESNVNHNKYIVNVSYSDIAFQCCRRDCFTVLRTNNMIRLVNRKIKKQWYMRKKRKGGGGGRPRRRKKKASQERQKCLGNNFQKHLDHPFTVMQPFVLQHTCTRTQTHKEEERRKKLNAEGEVMSITSTLLMTGWTNQVKKKTLWTR